MPTTKDPKKSSTKLKIRINPDAFKGSSLSHYNGLSATIGTPPCKGASGTTLRAILVKGGEVYLEPGQFKVVV